MIRVTVPRPVAEALVDGSLRLLVVDAEPECSLGYECDDTTHDGRCGEPRPDPAIVRAIEAGECIGIDVECERCEGHGCLAGNETEQPDGRWSRGGASPHPTASDVWVVDCPHCTDGRVPVGSVRPVRVLPVVHWSDNDEESPSCISVGHDDGRAFAAVGFSHNEINLSVYGPAESLVGKFAVEVEDARREP